MILDINEEQFQEIRNILKDKGLEIEDAVVTELSYEITDKIRRKADNMQDALIVTIGLLLSGLMAYFNRSGIIPEILCAVATIVICLFLCLTDSHYLKIITGGNLSKYVANQIIKQRSIKQ